MHTSYEIYAFAELLHRTYKAGNTVDAVPATEFQETIMIVAHLIAAIRRWASYRKTVAELSRLDDRSLNDLGILRSDIDAVARKAVAA